MQVPPDRFFRVQNIHPPTLRARGVTVGLAVDVAVPYRLTFGERKLLIGVLLVDKPRPRRG